MGSPSRQATLNIPTSPPAASSSIPWVRSQSSGIESHQDLHAPPRHPPPPTPSSWTFHPVILRDSPRHPPPPAPVIVNLIQDLLFASLDSGSSPDDGRKWVRFSPVVRCVIRPFCTLHDPKTRPRVRIAPFAHRKTSWRDNVVRDGSDDDSIYKKMLSN